MRTLASIAKAAIEAFSDRRGDSWASGPNSLAAPRASAEEPSRAVKLLEQTGRSLIAQIGLKAHYRRAQLKTIALQLDGVVIANVYCFERRLLGCATGFHDGVIVLCAAWEPQLLPWLCHRIQDFMAFDLATFGVVGPRLAGFESKPLTLRNRFTAAIMSARVVREVMPLDNSIVPLLERSAREASASIDPRSNQVVERDPAFDFVTGIAASPHSKSSNEVTTTSPTSRPFGKIASIERFLLDQPRPYRASLTRDDGQLTNLVSGFIERDLALIAYQRDLRTGRDAGPSLSLRALLAKRLIAEGARFLAFIGGCAGPLLPCCEPVPAAELLVIGNTRAARAKHRAFLLANPTSRVARLSAELAAVTETRALANDMTAS